MSNTEISSLSDDLAGDSADQVLAGDDLAGDDLAGDDTGTDQHHAIRRNRIWGLKSIRQTATSQALLFESRGHCFAVPTQLVREVIEVPQCTPLSDAPWWYCGLAVYQSGPVPLIDPVQYFIPAGGRPGAGKPAATHRRAIVISVASSTYLFAAERVLNLCLLKGESSASDADEYADEHPAIERVCSHENKIVTVIDVVELLRQTKLLREPEHLSERV